MAWFSADFLKDGFPAFSDKATRVLQHLLSEDVPIVRTTSHKSRFSIEEWKTIFQTRSSHIENLKALPENATTLGRKDAMLNWLKVNRVKEELIIFDDDSSLHELPTFLKQKWFHGRMLADIHSILDKQLEAAE